MVIGYFTNAGESRTQRTKTHLISEETWEPVCGSQISPEGEVQQVSRGLFYTAIECEHCKKLLMEMYPATAMKDADPYWPAEQLRHLISHIIDNEVTEEDIISAQRLTRANWIQALANGNPVMLKALNEEVKAMMLEEQHEYFRPN